MLLYACSEYAANARVNTTRIRLRRRCFRNSIAHIYQREWSVHPVYNIMIIGSGIYRSQPLEQNGKIRRLSGILQSLY